MQRSQFFQILITILLTIAFTTSCGSSKEKLKKEEPKPPEEQLPKPDWELIWTNLDCFNKDKDSESIFNVWWLNPDIETYVPKFVLDLCNSLPIECPPVVDWGSYISDELNIKVTVKMESTDLPSDGGIEVTLFGKENRKFGTGIILGEFTEINSETLSASLDFKWEPFRDTLKSNSDLDLALVFDKPIDTDYNWMITSVYYNGVGMGGVIIFKNVESDDFSSCP